MAVAPNLNAHDLMQRALCAHGPGGAHQLKTNGGQGPGSTSDDTASFEGPKHPQDAASKAAAAGPAVSTSSAPHRLSKALALKLRAATLSSWSSSAWTPATSALSRAMAPEMCCSTLAKGSHAPVVSATNWMNRKPWV